MGTMTSQITSLMIVYSTVYSSRRLKKTSKLRVTGLCEGNSPVTGEFPAQRASDTENVFFWWSHHDGGKMPQEFGCALYIACHYKTFSMLCIHYCNAICGIMFHWSILEHNKTFGSHLKKKHIFEHGLQIDFMNTSCEIALKCMPQDIFDDTSILVQVMAWCHQATSHYLSQSWHKSILSYGVTRP